MKHNLALICAMLLSITSFAQTNVKIMKNGKIVAQVFKQQGWEFKYGTFEYKPGYGNEHGHDYVEIGGVKWATMNLGATRVAGLIDLCYGDFYAWGETTPRYTYLYFDDFMSPKPVWKTSYPGGYAPTENSSLDAVRCNETTLCPEHDPATINWGAPWRTPTKADFEALFKACGATISNRIGVTELRGKVISGGIYKLSVEQTYEPEYTGIAGYLCVDKEDITKRVFFPVTGVFGVRVFGVTGAYWASSKDGQGYNYMEFGLWINNLSDAHHYSGRSIRPVVK